MSGLSGIIHLDGRPVEADDLDSMAEAMAHRGPDGRDAWRQGPAGLGQLRLHSTPESLNEKLPWQDRGSGLTITADARLDNREELAGKLGISLETAAPEGQALPDSQLILAAFRRWGDGCVDHLLGDFAFAIWNPVARRLFCARDAMGVRPFYYHRSRDLFVFASTACAVVAAPGVPRQLNEVRIGDGLVRALEGADATSSWFEEVYRLPPAHRAVLAGREFSLDRYWRPDPDHELKLGDDQEYSEALREQLTRAVERRLRCHRPVASMLSGGLDSSTIVGLARASLQKQGNNRLVTFTGASAVTDECRESTMSRLVIDQGGLDSVVLRPADVGRLNDRLMEVQGRLEDPFDSLWIMHNMIYLEAASRGHTVVLDGIDGDGLASLTTAYPGYLLRAGRWLTAHREIRGMKQNYGLEGYGVGGIYLGLLRGQFTPGFVRALKQRLFGVGKSARLPPGFIDPRFAEKIGIQKRWEALLRSSNPHKHPSLRHAHVARMTSHYLTAGIERYDRLAATCGVEARHPLLDRELVEFCISLPWRQKVNGGWSKWGMRRVAQHFLPHTVAWRTRRDQIMWKFWDAWDTLNRAEFHKQLDRLANQQSATRYLDYKGLKKACHSSIIGGSGEREVALEALIQHGWLEAWKG